MISTTAGVRELLRLSWRQNPTKFLAAIALKLTGAAALPLTALTLGMVTDAVVEAKATRAMQAAVASGVLTVAALTLAHFAHVLYFELGEINFLTKDRALIEIVNGPPGIAHLEQPGYADKMQVLQDEMRRVSYGSMEALLSSMSVGLAMVVTAVMLGWLHPLLLLLPLTAVPPILLGRRAEDLLGRARDQSAQSTRQARHLFELATDASAAKEIRVAGVQNEIRVRHARAWQEASKLLLPAEMRAVVLRIAGQLVFGAGYVAAALLVLRDTVQGRRSVGDVVLVISLATLVNNQVSQAVTLLQELQRVAKALADFRWLRELVGQDNLAQPDREFPARLQQGIRLRQLGFRYPGTARQVLDGVDLLMPAGSTVAIVGENGAGKTTLVKLLCRFYEPTHGRIEVDGVDLRRFPVSGWRQRIAAGFQDFVRFEFVARETVGVGELSRVSCESAVLTALKRARSQDILDRLENGLNTQLGRSYAQGAELSGGQWQKLALGRAMMRETPLLLVLDEPTASLDAESEHALFEQYAANARTVAASTGAITVLVSHRFSTVRMADVILVVADGGIVEAGDHKALMAKDGLYAELYGLQRRAYR